MNNICRFTVREDGVLIGVDTGMFKRGHVYEVKMIPGMARSETIHDLGVSQIARNNKEWSKISVDGHLATSGGRHLMVEGEK